MRNGHHKYVDLGVGHRCFRAQWVSGSSLQKSKLCSPAYSNSDGPVPMGTSSSTSVNIRIQHHRIAGLRLCNFTMVQDRPRCADDNVVKITAGECAVSLAHNKTTQRQFTYLVFMYRHCRQGRVVKGSEDNERIKYFFYTYVPSN